MKNALFILLLSVMLFSCRNENSEKNVTPEENAELPQETEQVTEEPAAIPDTIEVYQPRPGEVISSPLQIEGRARGNWYFEASFGITLVDENGQELALVPGEAQDSWMTRDWVDFSATMEFENPESEKGFLVFEKANPSGLEEHARELRVPVKFPPAPEGGE